MRGLARLISSAISSCAKTGPGNEAEAALAAGIFLQHFGAQNVGGHQVGRELDAARVEAEHDAHRFHKLGLGEARHADQKRVAAGQDRDQRLLDHLLLTENDGSDRVVGGPRMGGRGFRGPDDHVFELVDAFRRLPA